MSNEDDNVDDDDDDDDDDVVVVVDDDDDVYYDDDDDDDDDVYDDDESEKGEVQEDVGYNPMTIDGLNKLGKSKYQQIRKKDPYVCDLSEGMD